MPLNQQVPDESMRREIEELRAQLAESREVLRAIQAGEVDALVVSAPEGERVFTLKGADYSYRMLIESMSEGAVTLGADGTVLFCNRRVTELVDILPSRFIGHPIGDIVAPKKKELFWKLFQQALEGEDSRTELELEATGGRTIPVYVSMRKLMHDESTAVCMVVTDLTEQKEREELLASTLLARSILNSAGDAIAVCSQGGIVMDANEAFRKLCTCDPLFGHFDQLLPLRFAEAHKMGRDAFSIGDGVILDTQYPCEMVLQRAGREPMYLLMNITPLKGAADVSGFVVSLTNVTEQRRAEEMLLRSAKLATASRLAATMAHEINNPLESVTNAIYLAKTNIEDTNTVLQYLDVADDELKRVAHVTQQTLGFYRESSVPALVSLSAILDSSIELLRARAATAQAAIRPEYRGNFRVCGVAGELRQVFSNLLANSIEAVAGGGTVVVRTSSHHSVRSGGTCTRITIADSGRGIAGADLPRIFEPLFTTKIATGSGLGLWVAKEITEKHGGVIRIRTRTAGPWRGTAVSVTLPGYIEA